MKLLSLIVPCYNEQETIRIFYDEAIKTLADLKDFLDYEILFIDDGSKDDTLLEIKKLTKIDQKVKYISFSRNFGKEAAMYAGLENTKGDYIALMDVDLQDPPELLTAMYQAIEHEGCDCVATKRKDREGEPPIRSFFARLFYRLINKISKTEIVNGARDYRMMTRQMVEAILSLNEYNRFSKGIFSWVGFKTKWLEYNNVERVAGQTKWSFWKLFKYSVDGIVGFSTVPLSIASFLGLIICLFAFISIVVIIIKTLLWGDPVAGYPSMISIILLLGGIQLLTIGILGQYLSKTYMETKRRPIYITREKN